MESRIHTVRILIFLMLLTCCSLPSLYAQTRESRFTHFTREDGLPNSYLFDVLQDRQGFLWFSSAGGLVKYDGRSFSVYRYDATDTTGLGYNWIWTLFEDSQGMIWLGTDGGGADRFDPVTGRFTHFRHDPDNPNSLNDNHVGGIIEGSDGTFWLATTSGICNLNPATGEITRYIHNPDDPYTIGGDLSYSLCLDHEGILWVGTDNAGVSALNPATGRFTRYRHDPKDRRSIAGDSIHEIIEDRSGTIWISSINGGLNKFDRETGGFIRYTHDPRDPYSINKNSSSAIFEDRDGFIWVGSLRGGLNRFDPKTERFTRYVHDPENPSSLLPNGIHSLLEDRSGVLWITTVGGGISKLDLRTKPFRTYRHDPGDPNSIGSDNVLFTKAGPDGSLWISASGSPLVRHNPDTDQNQRYGHVNDNPNTLAGNGTRAIYIDRQGMVWTGGGGLNQLNPETGHVVRYTHDPSDGATISSNGIWSITEDKDGDIWAGTLTTGLNRLDRSTSRFTRYQYDYKDTAGISDNSVLALLTDRSGKLWIGTNGGGLNRYDRDTDTFVHYKSDPGNPQSLNSNGVRAIYEDREGHLWIGTDGGGLNRFDPATDTFEHYGTQDGLLSDVVSSLIQDDEGMLWLGTDNGISRVDPNRLINRHTGDTGLFQNFDTFDGLSGNEASIGAYTKLPDGRLAFASGNGLNLFDPRQIHPDEYVPSALITDFRLFNRSVPVGDGAVPSRTVSRTESITLNYRQSVFSFEFTIPHYAVPEQNQYAYKMDGFDEAWVRTGTRNFTTYTNLDPGEYTFRVRGANHDGVWNEGNASVRMVITPAPWETWWAYCLYVVLIIGGTTGYFNRHRHKLRRENELARVHQELGIAQRIQTSMLPKPSRDIQSRPEVDVAAVMYPANEVGGDLYDFFPLDENRMALLIGDVAEKGIPASLFMAMSLSRLRSAAQPDVAPHICLEQVNRLLTEDNEEAMFVTVFYGILDLKSGILDYSNGGHALPYHLINDADRTVRKLSNTGGLVLGADDNASYRTDQIQLASGDMLFLYSDGITEATDTNDMLFSDLRLESLLHDVDGSSSDDVIHDVVSGVRRFSAGIEQTDDITAMAVRYLGAPRAC